MSQGGTNVGGMDTQALFNRVLRVAQMDTGVFDEVRNDSAATIPSVIVAAVAILISGLGGLLWWIVEVDVNTGDFFVRSFLLGSVLAFALWFAWVGVTYVVLAQVFNVTADFQTLVRVMGMAMVPLALSFLFFIPSIGFGIAVASLGAVVAMSSLAVQAAGNTTPGKALLANGAGFLVWAIVLSLLAASSDSVSQVLAPNIFALASY